MAQEAPPADSFTEDPPPPTSDVEHESLPETRRRRVMSFSLPDDMDTVNKNATDLFKDLSKHVVDLYERKKDSLRNGQLLIAVAGGPGSGKSTLSEEVARRVNLRLQDGTVCVLPMDGFHYSRAQLKEMGEQPETVYTYDQLIQRRGAPWTFDADACVKAFSEAREKGEASLPVYDRDKSDPVPDGAVLKKTHTIVFLEGNYLLAWDDPNWAPLKGIFDETWYVHWL